MTVLVTAASGHLGRLVLDSLLARGVPAADIRAGARTPESLAGYADRGVDVVPLDYDDPASAAAAVKGVDRVLLVSGSEVGRRVEQHRAVIDAAGAEGVQHLIYTSAPKANDTTLVLAPEHRATEELARTSGIPFTMLRNNWYTENYAQDLATARATGTLVTSAGEGRVASAARADYAEAAAVVLTEDGHQGQVYELGGDDAWDFDPLQPPEIVGSAYTPIRADHAADIRKSPSRLPCFTPRARARCRNACESMAVHPDRVHRERASRRLDPRTS